MLAGATRDPLHLADQAALLHPVEELQGNQVIPEAAVEAAALARISREQARKLEAVTSIAVRLEGSTQGDDRELAEELYSAMGLT